MRADGVAGPATPGRNRADATAVARTARTLTGSGRREDMVIGQIPVRASVMFGRAPATIIDMSRSRLDRNQWMSEAFVNGTAPTAGGPSGVGFDGEGVAVGVLEPRDTSATGPGGDALGVVFELVVADELDAARGEFVDDEI